MPDYTRYDITEQEIVELETFDCVRDTIKRLKECKIPEHRIITILSLANNTDHLDALAELSVLKGN